MNVHVSPFQKNQLDSLAHTTGIDATRLLNEALCLFLERCEYILRLDPYVPAAEATHYATLAQHKCSLTIDLSCSPGNAIAAFLNDGLTLNTISLSYVVRKALALLFEGTHVKKKLHRKTPPLNPI